MAPVGTALVGFGLAGEVFHAPLIRACAALELRAVVSGKSDRIARAGLTQAESLAAVLADDAIALVVIAAPTAAHFELAQAALSAGKHVVVDKLFTASSDEARALIALAARRGRKLAVFHNRRWDGDFLTVRRLVEEDALGEVRLFAACWDRHRAAVAAHWKEEEGPAGGVLADLAPHLIDQALLLFGAPEQVSADILRQRDGAVADDYFELRLHYRRLLVRLGASMLIAAPRPRFALHGIAGSYVKSGLDPQQGQLKHGLRPGQDGYGEEPEAAHGDLVRAGEEAVRVPTRAGCYQSFYEQMAEAIRTGGEVPVDPRDALLGLRIIEAARESAASGRRIRFAA